MALACADYIHVVDLAMRHLKALERLQDRAECLTVNLERAWATAC